MEVSPPNLKETMSGKTAGELYAILHADEGEYTPDALEAAREEFSRRNPSQQEVTDFAEVAQRERKKAGVRLGWGLRAVAFFVSTALLFIPLLLAHRHFIEKGERRKAREWLTWALYGLAFYLAIGILARILG